MSEEELHLDMLAGAAHYSATVRRTFLVAAFRSPQVPSQSLPFPLDKVTQCHVCSQGAQAEE